MSAHLMRAGTWLATGATVYLTYLAMIPIVQSNEVAAAPSTTRTRDIFTLPDIMRALPPSPQKHRSIVRLLGTYDRLITNNTTQLPPAIIIDCMARLYYDPSDPTIKPNTNPAPLIHYLTTYRQTEDETIRTTAEKWIAHTTRITP